MQLFAHTPSKQPMHANNACKKIDYLCPECHSPVRVRRGAIKRAHFFHTKPTKKCISQGKSLTHLAIQEILQKSFPEKEVEMEVPFNSINRIADVVHFEKKIIFEVQCSSISSEEIESRTRGYESLGFQVVWIFHDSRFNKNLCQMAERWIYDRLHYFTNINAKGKGILYDQFTVLCQNRRLYKTERFPVRIQRPLILNNGISNRVFDGESPLPKILYERKKKARYHFEGDLLDRCKCHPLLVKQWIEMEKAATQKPWQKKRFSYTRLLNFWLKKAARH